MRIQVSVGYWGSSWILWARNCSSDYNLSVKSWSVFKKIFLCCFVCFNISIFGKPPHGFNSPCMRLRLDSHLSESFERKIHHILQSSKRSADASSVIITPVGGVGCHIVPRMENLANIVTL